MKKYIITNCPAYLKINKCLYNGHCSPVTDCLLKRIVELLKVDIDTCDRCDGVGYFEGCEDTNCCFYRIMKIQELLEIEECE